MVASEGAASFLVETRAKAQARGAVASARILGFGEVFTPRHGSKTAKTAAANGGDWQAADREGGEDAIRRAVTGALQRRVAPADVGSSARPSTVEDDRMEARAILRRVGRRAGDGIEVLLGASRSRRRRVGDGRGCLGVSARANSADAELRTARSRVSGPCGPRRPCTRGALHGVVLSYSHQGQVAATSSAANRVPERRHKDFFWTARSYWCDYSKLSGWLHCQSGR